MQEVLWTSLSAPPPAVFTGGLQIECHRHSFSDCRPLDSTSLGYVAEAFQTSRVWGSIRPSAKQG
jgi:hypothetical protein